MPAADMQADHAPMLVESAPAKQRCIVRAAHRVADAVGVDHLHVCAPARVILRAALLLEVDNPGNLGIGARKCTERLPHQTAELVMALAVTQCAVIVTPIGK